MIEILQRDLVLYVTTARNPITPHPNVEHVSAISQQVIKQIHVTHLVTTNQTATVLHNVLATTIHHVVILDATTPNLLPRTLSISNVQNVIIAINLAISHEIVRPLKHESRILMLHEHVRFLQNTPPAMPLQSRLRTHNDKPFNTMKETNKKKKELPTSHKC